MGGGFSDLRKLLAGFLADANVGLAAGIDEAFEARGLTGFQPFAGDHNVVKVAAAGFERFFYRVEAVKNLHLFSLVG